MQMEDRSDSQKARDVAAISATAGAAGEAEHGPGADADAAWIFSIEDAGIFSIEDAGPGAATPDDGNQAVASWVTDIGVLSADGLYDPIAALALPNFENPDAEAEFLAAILPAAGPTAAGPANTGASFSPFDPGALPDGLAHAGPQSPSASPISLDADDPFEDYAPRTFFTSDAGPQLFPASADDDGGKGDSDDGGPGGDTGPGGSGGEGDSGDGGGPGGEDSESGQTISGGRHDDTLSGGGGDDSINGLAGDDFLSGGAGHDTISGGSGNDTIYGDAGNDQLSGDAGRDVLFGDQGDDTISGGNGNDTIYGDAGNDQLSGDAGRDVLFGGDDGDTLNGGAGDDRLFGESGNDVLIGGAGKDYLSGGPGSDTLTGGTGKNTFALSENHLGADTDHITDFQAGKGGDTLDLSGVLNMHHGDHIADFVQTWSGSGDTHIDVSANGNGSWSEIAVLDDCTVDLSTLIANGQIVTS